MKIRLATLADYDAVWEIFHKVVKIGETYVFDPKTPKSAMKSLWFADNMKTYVAEIEGEILGTYFIKPNQIDLGLHIANVGYMVHPKAQGKGIGKSMCEHSLEVAKNLGFKAMQFNIVVSTNKNAIILWQKFGFEIIGTIPDAFNHNEFGFVDAHIMYKSL